MIKAFLESFEDPNRPLLGPNYWIMHKIGLMRPENLQKKYWKASLHLIGTVFVCTQFVELFQIRSNKDRVLTNLTLSMLSPIVVTKADTFLYWQDNVRQVFGYVTESDNFERNDQNETRAPIINSYTKYCRRLTYFYWVFTQCTACIICTTPLIKYYSSVEYQEGFRNGTEAFPHIFSSWMPIDKEHSPGCWITVLWHFLMLYYGSTVICAYDTAIVTALVFFGGKLDLLRVRCRELLGTNGAGVSDEQVDREVRKLHQMHVVLLKHSRLLNSLISPVMFVYMVMCTLLICSSAYNLNNATSTAQKVFIAEYLVFGVAQLFFFCFHSNLVIYKSSEVRLGPYESDWWAANLKQQKNVLTLQGQMSIEHMYTAGPFTNLTLATFITILKAAYSYYTLIR